MPRPPNHRILVRARIDPPQWAKLQRIIEAHGLAGRERATDTGLSAALRHIIDEYHLPEKETT
jgi:hypothetical protein